MIVCNKWSPTEIYILKLSFQASESYVHFVDVLWPEFMFWHLWGAVFQYQRHVCGLGGAGESSLVQHQHLHHHRQRQNSRLGPKCSTSHTNGGGSNGVLSSNGMAGGKSTARVDRFVQSVHTQKSEMLEELCRHSKSCTAPSSLSLQGNGRHT